MLVALERFDLRVPQSRSLKAKRHVIAPLTAAIRQRFPVSVAEVDHQDLWQRASLAVVAVSTDQSHVDRELAAMADEIERVEPGLITRTDVEFLA